MGILKIWGKISVFDQRWGNRKFLGREISIQGNICIRKKRISNAECMNMMRRMQRNFLGVRMSGWLSIGGMGCLRCMILKKSKNNLLSKWIRFGMK